MTVRNALAMMAFVYSVDGWDGAEVAADNALR